MCTTMYLSSPIKSVLRYLFSLHFILVEVQNKALLLIHEPQWIDSNRFLLKLSKKYWKEDSMRKGLHRRGLLLLFTSNNIKGARVWATDTNPQQNYFLDSRKFRKWQIKEKSPTQSYRLVRNQPKPNSSRVWLSTLIWLKSDWTGTNISG